MEKKNRIRVGLIGVNADTAWATITHMPALKALPDDYEVTAISNRNAEKGKEAGKIFGVANVYTNNHDLINSPEVDLVIVSVKVPEHRALVLDAINAGKAVFCEWPLGNGIAETEELAAAARAKGVPAIIGLQSRAIPEVQYVKSLIKDGYLGTVLSTTMIGTGIIYNDYTDAHFVHAVDIKNGGGMIYSSFGHAIDMALDALGEEFSVLSGLTENRRKTTIIRQTGETIPMTAFDQVALQGVLQSGTVVTAHYRGGMLKDTNFLWEIHGTAGQLLITADGGHPAVFPLTIKGSNSDAPLQKLEVPDAFYLAKPEGLSRNAFNQAQYYAWMAKDLREGTHLTATFEDALLRYRMLEALQQSAKTGMQKSYL